MLKTRGKRTVSIFMLLAAICLLLPSCENPLIQKILEYKTVSFNTNGGSSVPAQNLIKGWKITRPDDPVKPDFIFDGWYKDNDVFMYEWDFDDIPAADMILHAKWIDDEKIQITFAAVYVTAPETGQIPADSAEPDVEGGANYSIEAVSWSPDHNPFQQDTQYTVSVTLTADEGYTFRNLTGAFINEQAANLSGNTGKTVTLSLTFESTIDIIVQFDLQTKVNEYQSAMGDMVIRVPGSLRLTENITVPANANGYTLTITSDRSSPYTIYRGWQDTNDEDGLFIVSSGAKLVFQNIVIDGNKTTYTENAAPLVRVNGTYTQGGTFTLGSGAVLKNNKANVGGGVYIGLGSSFTMNDGSVSGNTAENGGGGVYIDGGGTFTMTGGSVSGNTASGNGGGVLVSGSMEVSGGTFNMSDNAKVSGNQATSGGGVFVGAGTDSGTFNMYGTATVSDNTATDGGGVYTIGKSCMNDNAKVSGNIATNGGGVYISGNSLQMDGGTISGNKATDRGGGVCLNGGNFNIFYGTVYGDEPDTDTILKNTAFSGAALYIIDGEAYKDSSPLSTTDLTIN